MPNLDIVSVARTDSGNIRVTGRKGSGESVKVYLNGNLIVDAPPTPGTDFDHVVAVGAARLPHTIKVVSSDGKEDSEPVTRPMPDRDTDRLDQSATPR